MEQDQTGYQIPIRTTKVIMNDVRQRHVDVHAAMPPDVTLLKTRTFVIVPDVQETAVIPSKKADVQAVSVASVKPAETQEVAAAPVKPADVQATAAAPVKPLEAQETAAAPVKTIEAQKVAAAPVKPAETQEMPVPSPKPAEAPAMPAASVEPAASPAQPSAPEPAPQPLSDDDVLRHTAMLWQYKPVPDESVEPDRKTETYAMQLKTSSGEMYGARVRGKKHKHEGTNSDDWFAIDALGRIQLIAVADGAGSKHFSRVGAYAASEQAVKSLKEKLAELSASCDTPEAFFAPFGEATDRVAFQTSVQPLVQALQQAMRDARAAVEDAYKARAKQPRYAEILHRDLTLADFSSTLLVALALPAGTTGDTLVLSCQIGDGMIAAIDATAPFDKAQRLLGKPDSGEYVGETEFLVSDRVTEMAALQNRTMLYRGHVTHIFAMTDGVADDYFPNEKEMRRLYCDLLANGVLLPPKDMLGAEPSTFEGALEERRSLRKIKPVAFPWVNDKTVEVALHYTRRFAPTEDALASYWTDQRKLAMLSADADIAPDDPIQQRIAKWLDNYTVRSSADDRTLVVAVREAGA
ncbi:PP2C family serine/threonine-protein phosphatase [uncultured Selenomonas sp.]|uniref:PP2C family serine/threonine-protein phosphatase n=1 Tax=uncultured Selenomonas sp. TaxID=159275 RepID=UPI0025ECBFE8|nr:protein phosphatase 2C domain-containing protein [uncultured Selenomonas sp.]